MSQDQKPGRVRVVKGVSGGDAGVTDAGAAAAAGKAGGKPGKARGGLVPVALFLVGCIGGGVAVARLMP